MPHARILEFVKTDLAAPARLDLQNVEFDGYVQPNEALASGELECTVDNWVESTGTVYDEGNYPVIGDNLGTAEQTWTIARLSDTQFSCTGDTIGSLATGSTAADYAPLNPANSKPYFTLESAGWLSAIPTGYTLVFQTHPPAIPTHEFRCIPPACGQMTGDSITLCLEVETV